MNSISRKICFMITSLLSFTLLSGIIFFGAVKVKIAAGQSPSTAKSLNVALTVKETAGLGTNGYPITAIVPLQEGSYQDVNVFRVVDAFGSTVPAQFEVLNRWWSKDGSIRHVAVHFQPVVSAFAGSGTGLATYYLKDDGNGNYSPSPIALTETAADITVNTGVLKFVVKKNNFNILDQVWLDLNKDKLFESNEQIISSSPLNGGILVPRMENTTGIQYDSSRSDITVEIEESGPMRVVIRAEALTKYNSTTNHTHGWAVRIYAYADKPYVKVDYQLQNSAMKNDAGDYQVYAWPLYFESMDMNFTLNLDGNPTVKFGTGDGTVYTHTRNNGIYLAQTMHDQFEITDAGDNSKLYSGKIPEGFICVNDGHKGVTAMTRNFWQMWPNGLKVDRNNKLSIQLFPEWSAQFYYNKDKGTYELNSTGLYWLEDMQQVYKETLLFFHDSAVSGTVLSALAKTFQYHPVAVIPIEQYRETAATLDLAGMIPEDSSLAESTEDRRIPSYESSVYDTASIKNYQFNWDNFKVDVARKAATGMPGGWPYGNGKFIVTGNPADYFNAEDFAMGELNVRPQWMTDYSHEEDWSTLQLSENPYDGGNWRKFSGHGKFHGESYLDGTGKDAKARDDEHGWFYHIEEAYNLTGNPWIKDWYKFIGEFRRVRLHNLDPWPNLSSRAVGHSFANAIQAYQTTGVAPTLSEFRDYINWFRGERQDQAYGYNISSSRKGEAAFQAGFLLRAVIDYMEEVRGKDWQAYSEAFQFISGYMEWNLNYSNFGGYIFAAKGEIGKSSGSALSMVDPQMWYYWNTGRKKVFDQVEQYMTNGINGGHKPYGNFKQWSGQYESRYYLFVKHTPRNDTTPPAAITDLKAVRSGSDVVLTWTAPRDNDLERYHIVWSTKPISEIQTTDSSKSNWWATNVLGPDLFPISGTHQTLTIPSVSEGPIYVAIFTFDQQQNMSKMSNVAIESPGTIEKQALKVSKIGTGTITSNPSGIDCGNVCQAEFNEDTVVILTAIATPGSIFAGWSGEDCRGKDDCVVTMDTARSITATFEPDDGDVLFSQEPIFEFDRGGDSSIPIVYRGDTISYQITATNTFESAVSLLISDALSALVDYVSGTLKVNETTVVDDLLYFNANVLEYESIPLEQDQSLTISFDVIVSADAPLDEIISNTALFTAYFVGLNDPIFSGRSSNAVQVQVGKPVPEPSTFIFLGTGLLGTFIFVRKNQGKKK